MKRKLCTSIGLVAITPVILTGCTSSISFNSPISPDAPIIPEKITILGQSDIYLGCGEYKYTVEVEPAQAAKEVKWSSSDASILTIDEKKGIVQTHKAGGPVTITAESVYDDKVKDVLSVNVINIPDPTAITIQGPSSVILHQKPSYHYNIVTEPELAKSEVVWSVVEGTGQATIKPSGDLYPTKAGTVTIHAQSNYAPAISNDFPVLIKAEAPKSIQIEGHDGVKCNTKNQFTVKAEPEGTLDEVTWSVDRADLGTISPTGELETFGASGTITITATSLADSSIQATKQVFVSDNIIYVSVANTIGHGFDWVGNDYVVKGESYQLKFISSVYKNDSDWWVIHKELKNTDLEVMYDNADVMKECSMEHNVLTIPSKYTNSEDLTIHLLGAEISDTVTWDDIATITEKDYEDYGRAEKHYGGQYFQVGDYKKGYVDHKYQGEFVIVDEYHDYYEDKEYTERINVPIALTFMQRVLHVDKNVANDMPTSDWEDKCSATPDVYDCQTKVVYDTKPLEESVGGCHVRTTLLDHKMYDGMKSSSIVCPIKHITPRQESDGWYVNTDKLWIPSFAEVYSDVDFIWKNATFRQAPPDSPHIGIPVQYHDEGSLYAYFDPAKYPFYHEGHPRMPIEDVEYDDPNYVDVPVMLRTSFTTYPTQVSWEPTAGPEQVRYQRGIARFVWVDENGKQRTNDNIDIDDKIRARYLSTYHYQWQGKKYKYNICFCI